MAIRVFTVLAYDADSPHSRRIAEILFAAKQRMDDEEFF